MNTMKDGKAEKEKKGTNREAGKQRGEEIKCFQRQDVLKSLNHCPSCRLSVHVHTADSATS
jgi:hypothetical protein